MKYLLTFKPLKNFFFGNRQTFNSKGVSDEKDYLAISEYFPQNTQLLGAIRLFIAEQNKLMHLHRNGKYSNEPEKLKKLIGTASSKDFDLNSDLGAIQNLSQMFIVNSDIDDAYFSTPFDIEINKQQVRYYELANIEDNYFLKDYSAKNASYPYLAKSSFWQKYINKEKLSFDDLEEFDYDAQNKKGVFVKHTQVGIGLENKKTVDGAFYSKVDYNLADGYLFSCLVDFDGELEDGVIQIGAESSLFELKILKYEDTNLISHPIVSKLFTQVQYGDKLVAISDVMLDSTKELNSHFWIVPFYKKFAMLKSQDEGFNNGSSKHKNYQKFSGKTKQKRLVPQGSVFYTKAQTDLTNHSLGAYSKMGYNQFLIVKK